MKSDMPGNARQTASIRNFIIGLAFGFAITMIVLNSSPTMLGYVRSEDLDESIHNYTIVVEKCEAKHKALSVSFEEAKHTADQAQTELSECNSKASNVKSELENLNKQNGEISHNLETANDQLREAEAKMNDFKAQKEEMEKLKNEESEKAAKLTDELNKIKAELQDSRDQLAGLKTKLDEAMKTSGQNKPQAGQEQKKQ